MIIKIKAYLRFSRMGDITEQRIIQHSIKIGPGLEE